MKSKFDQLNRKCVSAALSAMLFIACGVGLACERDTKLNVTGGNPPRFVMSGNGVLTAVRVRGPHKQREAKGENASLYWLIETNGSSRTKDRVEQLSSLTYGVLPEGFHQVYPESGPAPPVIEGEHYYVRIITSEANGDDGYFVIRNSKVTFAKYESELPQ